MALKLTIERVEDWATNPRIYLFSLANSTQPVSGGGAFTCTTTSPIAGASLNQGAATISGTTSQPASAVSVTVGGRTFAAVVALGGLTWSCSWPVDRQDHGPQTIVATATAVGGGTAEAPPVAVTTTRTTISITAETVIQNTWIQDSLKYIARGTVPDAFVEHDPSARYELYTSDTTLVVKGVRFDVGGLAVYVNGVFNQYLIAANTAVKQPFTITLPAGAKYVEIEEEGIGLTDIGAPGCSVGLVPYYAPRYRVLMYGTSINVGYGTAGQFRYGWPQLMRHAQSKYSICNNSFPGAAFNDQNSSHGATDAWVTSLAPRIDGTVETVLFVDRETNDFGGVGATRWTAAAYSAALAYAYDKVHAVYPNVRIVYATACTRTSPAPGTPNGLGDSLANYRTAGMAAATGRAFVRNIDVYSLPGVSLADGLHPDNAGAAAIQAGELANFWNPL